jgi:hypothetical protein
MSKNKNIKPIHKWNNGNLATLCHQCNCIISLGHTEELLCKNCSTNKRYYVLMEYEPSWMWTKDGDELDWSIVNYNLKEVSPRVEIAEEGIYTNMQMYSEFILMSHNEGLPLLSAKDWVEKILKK